MPRLISFVCIKLTTKIKEMVDETFHASRWFTRGWTLQELIAPRNVVFFDREWRLVGTKLQLRATISDIITISETVLATCMLDECTVRERLSWAAYRQTTRVEDAAYCLLGIFNINMPLLYGEGQAAFERLQQAILNQNEDYSIFPMVPTRRYVRSSGRLRHSVPNASLFLKRAEVSAISRDRIVDYGGIARYTTEGVALRKPKHCPRPPRNLPTWHLASDFGSSADDEPRSVSDFQHIHPQVAELERTGCNFCLDSPDGWRSVHLPRLETTSIRDEHDLYTAPRYSARL